MTGIFHDWLDEMDRKAEQRQWEWEAEAEFKSDRFMREERSFQFRSMMLAFGWSMVPFVVFAVWMIWRAM